MAFIPLATTTTLKIFGSYIRLVTDTLSIQDSQLLDPMLADMIHKSVLEVRERLAPRLDQKYLTRLQSVDGEIAEVNGLIDISAVDMSDAARVSLYDSSYGIVPIKTSQEFDSLKTIYSGDMLASAVFARIANLHSSNNTLQIEVFRGADKATSGDLVFSYFRNPVKAVNAADKLDLPEEFIPLAQDLAAVNVFTWKKSPVPADLQLRVGQFRKANG